MGGAPKLFHPFPRFDDVVKTKLTDESAATVSSTLRLKIGARSEEKNTNRDTGIAAGRLSRSKNQTQMQIPTAGAKKTEI